MSNDAEQAKIRASNRRTILGIGLVVAVMTVPALYVIGKYLIGLI